MWKHIPCSIEIETHREILMQFASEEMLNNGRVLDGYNLSMDLTRLISKSQAT